LELAHKQLNAQASNIKMELVRPGMINTQGKGGMDVDHYVSSVLKEHTAWT